MKLYRVDYRYDESKPWQSYWHGTQASAKLEQREQESLHGVHNVMPYVAVEVPTSKPELLQWLNEHVITYSNPEDEDDTAGAGDE